MKMAMGYVPIVLLVAKVIAFALQDAYGLNFGRLYEAEKNQLL